MAIRQAIMALIASLAVACPAAADRPAPGEGRILFAADERLALPHAPWDIEAGDLDGDGHADLIATTAGGFTVLMGSATGPAPAVVLPHGASYRVLAADLDGDGASELLTSRGSYLMVWRWESGQLIEIQRHEIEEWSSSIAAADLDNDGDLDVILAMGLANKVATLTNDGSGGLSPVGSFEAGTAGGTFLRLMRVASADVDGDGIADVVATDAHNERVVIFPGLGDGHLGVPTGVEVPQTWTPTTTVLALGDFDGDGDMDIALGEDGVQVLFNEGGSFRRWEYRTSLVNALEDIVAHDIDGDGFTDIVALNRSGYETECTITVLRGPIGETPRAHAYIAAPRPTALVAADVDADGLEDVVVATEWSPDPSARGTLSILRNRGFGMLHSIARFPMPETSGGVHTVSTRPAPLAVIELDSGPGLVLQGGNAGYLVRNDGRGWFHEPELMADAYPVAIEDLSDDGHADILVPDGHGEWHVKLGDGTGRFAFAGSVPAGGVLGDVDGDGLRDLVYGFETGALEFRRNEGGGAFGAPRALGVVPAAPRATARLFANLDGRRGDELVLGLDGPQRADTIEVWTNWQGRALREPVRLDAHASEGCCWIDNERPTRIEHADLDSDGREDLVMYGRSVMEDGYLATFLNAGRGEWRAVATVYAGKEPGGMVIADFDLDGMPDIAVPEISSSTSGRTRVLRGVGDGTFEYVTTYYPGDYPFAIAAADFDMDGRADLAVACARLDVVAVLTNASETPGPRHVAAPVLGTESDGGLVRVRWLLGAGLRARIQRAETGRHWENVAIAQLAPVGHVEFVDSDVRPGRRYGYRLDSMDLQIVIDGSEAWVKLMPRGGIRVHELARSAGTAAGVTLTIETSEHGEGQVELFDVGGRRVAFVRHLSLEVGAQRVTVPVALGQGIYWARVTSGEEIGVGRIVVLK